MKLYITAPSIFVLIVFYLPVVLWVLWRIWRSPRLKGAAKAGLLILTPLLAYAIPLGDVTINSLAMAKVCPSAGLHIYKTVEVDGYIYSGSEITLRQSPYQFIESPQLNVDGTYYWNRYEKLPDATITQTHLDQPTAAYEIVYEQWHVDNERGIESSHYIVRNRTSGEILAERNLFNPLPGWLDKILVFRWFGTGGREGCHGAPSAGIDESKILHPKQHN